MNTRFVVQRADGTNYMFKTFKMWLFFSDVNRNVVHLLPLVNTVDRIKSIHTLKEYSDAYENNQEWKKSERYRTRE